MYVLMYYCVVCLYNVLHVQGELVFYPFEIIISSDPINIRLGRIENAKNKLFSARLLFLGWKNRPKRPILA